MPNKDFLLYEDRAKSLLERWRRFYNNHQDWPEISGICISGFLSELNDPLIVDVESMEDVQCPEDYSAEAEAEFYNHEYEFYVDPDEVVNKNNSEH